MSNEQKTNSLNLFISSLLLFFLVITYGCWGGKRHYVRPNTDISDIKRIAVLPFENFTSDKHAGDKVRSMVIIEMLSRGMDVIEPGEVIKTLLESNVRSIHTISVADIQNMGDALGIKAVLMGSVESFGMSRGMSVSYPEVTIHLMMLDTESGDIIWSTWHSTGGASFWTRHFGAEGRTLDETSSRVVKEAFNTFF